MSNIKEISKESAEKLYDLLMVNNAKDEAAMRAEIDRQIKRAKAAMTKEEIAWVEKQFN